MFAIAGNHEYETAGAAPYYDYLGWRAGQRGLGYYAFDLGAWHIVWLARRMEVVYHESHPVHLSRPLARFWAMLVREITVSNIDVVRAILSPGPPIQPHFIRVRTRQSTDLGKVILANSITLTPGTVTVDVQGDELLVHALTEASGRAVEEGQLDRAIPLDCDVRG